MTQKQGFSKGTAPKSPQGKTNQTVKKSYR